MPEHDAEPPGERGHGDTGSSAPRPEGERPVPSYDDDELAAALRAQLLRFAPSGPVPTIPAARPRSVPGSPRSTVGSAQGATLPPVQPAAHRAAGPPELSVRPRPGVVRPSGPAHAARRSSGQFRSDETAAQPAGQPPGTQPPEAIAPHAVTGTSAAPLGVGPLGVGPLGADLLGAAPQNGVPSQNSALPPIDRLEALSPRLQRVQLDEAKYREWVSALHRIGRDADPTSPVFEPPGVERPLFDRPLDRDVDDDADDVPQPFVPAGPGPRGSPSGPPTLVLNPIASPRMLPGEYALRKGDRTRAGSRIEDGGLEPVAQEVRTGPAVRLFWLWFAANSSFLTVALGAIVYALGLSLRQSIVAALLGVALSAFPLGLGALAGRRTGQSTMILSRATFGLTGNTVPAVLAVAARLLWGAVLLWLLASATGTALRVVQPNVLPPAVAAGIGLGLFFLLALAGAVYGFPLLGRILAVAAVASTVFGALLVALTWSVVDLPAALATPDGAWSAVLGGAVSVFAILGLSWAVSSADPARYQSGVGSAAATFSWAWLGAAVPGLLLVSYGSLLAASNRPLAVTLPTDPVAALLGVLPGWAALPLLVAVSVGLSSALLICLYSGGLGLQALRLPLSRPVAVIVAALPVAALAGTLLVTGASLAGIVRDVAPLVAVPVAAWLGIFGGELIIRSAPFDADGLLRPGGRYPSVRWRNLVGLILVSALGYGLVATSAWRGYLLSVLGVGPGYYNLGVLLALLLGVGIGLSDSRALRRQEARAVPAQRR